MKGFLYQALLVVMALMASRSSLNAEKLDDLLSSNVIKEMKHDSRKVDDISNTYFWLQEGKNFSLLFAERNGAHFLTEWLGVPNNRFQSIDQRDDTNNKTAYARTTYKGPNGSIILLEVYVPHPRYRDWVEYGLMQETAALESPKLDSEFSEKITVNSHEATYNKHRKDNLCSLLFKLPVQTRVNLKADCKFSEEMKELGSSLSLDKLSSKLTS